MSAWSRCESFNLCFHFEKRMILDGLFSLVFGYLEIVAICMFVIAPNFVDVHIDTRTPSTDSTRLLFVQILIVRIDRSAMLDLVFSQIVHFQAILRQNPHARNNWPKVFRGNGCPIVAGTGSTAKKLIFENHPQRRELNQTDVSKNDPEQTYLIKHSWSVYKWKLSIYFWFLRKSFEFGIFWRISAVTSATDVIHSISSRNSDLNRNEFTLQRIGLKLWIVEMRIFTIHIRPIFIVAP